MSSPLRYSFTDDYSEGAHERLLEAIVKTNSTQQVAYGNDAYCTEAAGYIRGKLSATEAEVDIHFVPSGTVANIICIASCLRAHEAVVTVDSGHIASKEAGAIEATGHKLIMVQGVRGKITPEALDNCVMQNQFFPHMAPPRLVYISNSSELGTVYTRQDLLRIREVCDRWNLLLLMDGARIGVAIESQASENLSLRDLVDLTDIFWIGGTKNGALLGEAIVVRRHLANGFVFYLKQHGALLAKSRIIGVQFAELFRDNLFFELAARANRMAARIADNFERNGYELAAKTETNQVFAVLPVQVVSELQERYAFYVWGRHDEQHVVVRIVTSWATSELEVDNFNICVRKFGK